MDAVQPYSSEDASVSGRWAVHKFGGSSLADAGCIRKVVSIYESRKGRETQISLVLSAMQGVTDTLVEAIELAKRQEDYEPLLEDLKSRHLEVMSQLDGDSLADFQETLLQDIADLQNLLRSVWLSKSCSPEVYSLIVGYGELWSSQMVAMFLKSLGHDVQWLNAREFIVVDNLPTGPAVHWQMSKELLQSQMGNGDLVVTGFIARTGNGLPTTLKRNGSDLSAAIMGILLDAEGVYIWTDVKGVYSADPRRVPNAVVIDELSYLEALELAYFGAKVLHPGTIFPVMEHGLPLWVKCTFEPDFPGTRIYHASLPDTRFVKGFAVIEDIAVITLEGTGMIGVPGIAEKMFGALSDAGVSVIMISQASSEYSICAAIRNSDAEKGRRAVQSAFSMEILEGHVNEVRVETNGGILSVVGDGMVRQPGIASILFTALARGRINVRMISQGSSERNISVVLAQDDLTRGLRAVHSAFYLSKLTLSVGLIGVGLIGSAFLKQLREQVQSLRENWNLDVRINAIANSKRMVIGDGLDLSEWSSLLESGEPLDLDKLERHVGSEVFPHSVIIDCTASEDVAAKYPQWLSQGIHIITPNKKANSGETYRQLEAFIHKGPSTNPLEKNTFYLYETTVGAGLPIISTLHDLIMTGDQILTIEGIFSGTISYIFNELDMGRSFSDVLKDAKEKGYTEPDPRDDLSGMDFARKLVILSREMGLDVSLSDVSIEPLVPEPLLEGSVEEFMAQVNSLDGIFAEKTRQAKEHGQVLRYVGLIHDGKCSIRLQTYPQPHPFSNLQGSENIVIFHTLRYNTYPLIIRGPGAGAEVTAAGVFADLLRLAERLGST